MTLNHNKKSETDIFLMTFADFNELLCSVTESDKTIQALNNLMMLFYL